MILFPLLLPSGLLRRGLGGGGRHKCGKTWSQGSWLRPPLSFPSAFGHLGEEAAREEVQAGGGGRLPEADMQREGHREMRETWLGYPEALSDERQAPCLAWGISVLAA